MSSTHEERNTCIKYISNREEKRKVIFRRGNETETDNVLISKKIDGFNKALDNSVGAKRLQMVADID